MTEPSAQRPVPGPPRPGSAPFPAPALGTAPPAPAPGAALSAADGRAEDARTGAASDRLAGLDELPVAEHVAVFQAEHERLQRELGTIDPL